MSGERGRRGEVRRGCEVRRGRRGERGLAWPPPRLLDELKLKLANLTAREGAVDESEQRTH